MGVVHMLMRTITVPGDFVKFCDHHFCTAVCMYACSCFSKLHDFYAYVYYVARSLSSDNAIIVTSDFVGTDISSYNIQYVPNPSQLPYLLMYILTNGRALIRWIILLHIDGNDRPNYLQNDNGDVLLMWCNLF